MGDIGAKFNRNVGIVFDPVDFDRHVLGVAIGTLEALETKLLVHHKLDNPHLSARNAIGVLKNISTNNSLRPMYEQMFNQCVVLLASYFGSAVGDVFRKILKRSIADGPSEKLGVEEMRFTMTELRDLNFDLSEKAPDLFLQKKEISFQDTKSIARAFKQYFSIEIPRDDVVNEIIVGLASRHAIVHAGGIVDKKMIRQLRDATPRALKSNLTEGEAIKFSPQEIRALGDVMKRYVSSLEEKADGWKATDGTV